MLPDPTTRRGMDGWLGFTRRAIPHANAENGMMALALGGVLYLIMPFGGFIAPFPLSLGAGLLAATATKATKRWLKRRARRRAIGQHVVAEVEGASSRQLPS